MKIKIFIDEQTGFLNLFEIRRDEAILSCTKLDLVAGSFRASTDKPEFFWEYLRAWATTSNKVPKKSSLYANFVEHWNTQPVDFIVTDLKDEAVIKQIYKRASEHEQQTEFQKAANELANSGTATEYMTIALRQYSIDTGRSISEIQKLAEEDPDELLSYIWGEWGYSRSVNPDDDAESDPDTPPCRGPVLVP